MKILFSQLIALCFCTLLLSNSPLLVAQTATQTNNNLPPSFKYKLKKEVPIIEINVPQEQIDAVERRRNSRFPIAAGYTDDKHMDFTKLAVCEKLPNGDKVWRLQIVSNTPIEQIGFVNTSFSKNGTFYWYNEKKEYRKWATSNENTKQIRVYGILEETNKIFLEYYQTAKTKIKQDITISSVSTMIVLKNSLREEEEINYGCIPLVRCNCADYNCPSPSSSVLTANELKNKISRSVVRMIIHQSANCTSPYGVKWNGTGTFINNFGAESGFYIFTAKHNLANCYFVGDEIPLHLDFYLETATCTDLTRALE